MAQALWTEVCCHVRRGDVGAGGGGGARGVALPAATDVSDRETSLRSELRFLHSEALLVALREAGQVSK